MNNSEVSQLVDSADPKMKKALEHLDGELASLRTGRATTALVEGITVEQYGQTMPLKALATLSTPDAHTIAIAPWDPGSMAVIEKAIRETQSLGITPSNDGQIIRLNVPPMTEDRRREIVKSLGDKVEACRITLRNIRHDILGDVRRMEKDKKATVDDAKGAEIAMNKKIDQFGAKIDEMEKAKGQEIMAV